MIAEEALAPLSEAARELVRAAAAVSARAYSVYSGYSVGAALRGRSGKIYAGCNVENASYGATICAERSAVFAMVASGETEIAAVAVFAPAEPIALPCGLCRQVLVEFAADDAEVWVASQSRVLARRLGQLLPEAFRLEKPK